MAIDTTRVEPRVPPSPLLPPPGVKLLVKAANGPGETAGEEGSPPLPAVALLPEDLLVGVVALSDEYPDDPGPSTAGRSIVSSVSCPARARMLEGPDVVRDHVRQSELYYSG